MPRDLDAPLSKQILALARGATARPWTSDLVPTSVGSCFKINPPGACIYADGLYEYNKGDPGYAPKFANAALIVLLANHAERLAAAEELAAWSEWYERPENGRDEEDRERAYPQFLEALSRYRAALKEAK